ncbi:MAG: efflux RND transporter periplasmic adaptor subunit [Dehalococcoidales bacterium]|nr:efflux RND transporter periplasmic adaptor subunit [Dehalococcoidales bacterium]
MKIWKTIGVLVIIGALLAGAVACNPFGGTPAAQQQTAEVTRGNLTISVSGDGTIEASRTIKLTFTGAGRMTELRVKKGDPVKKGDVIARLDTAALELAKSQAQTAVTQAQYAVTQAKLAQQTAEYTLTRTKDSRTTLEAAVYTAQLNRKIAEVALENAEETAPAPDLQAAIDEVNRKKIYLQYALDSQSTATDPTTWDLVIARAQADLESAEAALDRITTGVDEDDVAIKKMQLQSADNTLAQARKNLDDLARDIILQEAQVEAAKDAVKQAENAVELAQKSLVQAQKQLNEATLTAPFDGIVISTGAEEQEVVSSLNVIATLLDTSAVALMVDIDEIDIPGVKLDQEAIISVDALPDTTIKGTVADIYPMPKNVGGVVQYEVKIAFSFKDNPAVRIGMSAQADIITNQRSNVLLVPSRAIEKDDQGNQVVNLIANGQVQNHLVVTGISDGLQTEITSGLSEGESVAIITRSRSSSSQSFMFGQ